jgi:hypothetical protein
MRERIAELAKQNGRSMNTEIVHRLETSLAGGGDNANLLVAIAQLNVELAKAEADKLGLRTEASNLALSVQQACSLALKLTESPNVEQRKTLQGLLDHAIPYIRRLSTIEADIQARMEGLRAAAMNLAAARGNLMGTEDTSKFVDPTAHPVSSVFLTGELLPSDAKGSDSHKEPPRHPQPAGGLDLDSLELPEPPQPTEPPKRPTDPPPRRMGSAKRRALEEAAAGAAKLDPRTVAQDLDHSAPKPKKKI